MTNGTDSGSDDGTLPLISEQIIGNYQLLRPIGSGAMGEVYLARHRQFKDRQYAIKLIRQGMISTEARTRFEREILAMGDLAHPNLVYANDAGMDGDRMYLVMEYVSGEELQCMIDQHGKFRVPYAAEIIRQICVGIAHAHQRSVVHRDIKPANVMVSDQMQVKVLDLGIASLQNDAASRMTTAQSVMGTAPFISPELWEGATNATPASDVYAIGCTAYCLLTGEPPFAGEKYQSLTSVMLAHRESAPTPLKKLRKDVPPELHKLLYRTLDKNPANRLSDAAELARLITPFCEPLPRDTAKLFGERTEVDLPSVTVEDAQSGPVSKSKFKTTTLAFIALVLAAAVASAVWLRPSSTLAPEPQPRNAALESPTVEQTWLPENCQKAPGAISVTVEFGGLKEKLWSELLLTPSFPNDAELPEAAKQPIPFLLVPQCGTSKPMSFYIMKEKVSKDLFAAFESAYPESIDPEAAAKRRDPELSLPNDPTAYLMTGREASLFAQQVCAGKLPKPGQWDAAFGRAFDADAFQNWISADQSFVNKILNRLPTGTSEDDLEVSRWGCLNMGSQGFEFTRYDLERDAVPDQLDANVEVSERELRGISTFSDGGRLQLDDWVQSGMPDEVYFGAKPINVAAPNTSFRVVLDKDD